MTNYQRLLKRIDGLEDTINRLADLLEEREAAEDNVVISVNQLAEITGTYPLKITNAVRNEELVNVGTRGKYKFRMGAAKKWAARRNLEWNERIKTKKNRSSKELRFS